MHIFRKSGLSLSLSGSKAGKITAGLCSFFLPVLCMLIAMSARGVFLRGNGSLFAVEAPASLLSRMASAREAFAASPLSGFVRSQGMDLFFALAAILPCSLHTACIFGILLTVGFLSLSFWGCALSLGIRPYPALLSALLYGMSSFSFVCFFVPGASTFLLFMPLVIASLHLLIRRGYVLPYAFSLLLSLAFYLRGGFVLLVCSLLWFVFDLFAYTAEEDRLSPFSSLVRYLVGTLLSLTFSLGTLAGALRLSEIVIPEKIEANFTLLSLLMKMLPATYDGITASSLPYAWFGLLVLLAVPFYFACSSVRVRERVGAGILTAVSLMGVSFFLLSRLWDKLGNNALPGYLPIAFFGFLLLLFSARGLSLADADNRRPFALFAALGFVCILLIFAQKLSFTYVSGDSKTPVTYVDSIHSVWISLFLLFALCGAVYAYTVAKNKKRCTAAFLLLLVIMLEASFSQSRLLLAYQTEHTVYDRTSVRDYYDALDDAKKYLDNTDTAGYRAEILSSVLAGDTLSLGQASSGVSDTYDDFRHAMITLGMTETENGFAYRHVSPAIDTLLGVRYLVARVPADPQPEEPDKEEEPEESKVRKTIRQIKEALFPSDDKIIVSLPDADAATVSALYPEVYRDDRIIIYENPYATPSVTAAFRDLRKLDLRLPTEDDILYDEKGNITGLTEEMRTGRLYAAAERLEAIWSAITWQTSIGLFTPITEGILRSSYNANRTSDALGQSVYAVKDAKDAQKSRMEFSFTLSEACSAVLSLPAITGCEAQVYLNDRYLTTVNHGDKAENGLIALGHLEPGRIDVKIYFARSDASASFSILDGQTYFYKVNDAAFETMMAAYTSPVKTEVTSAGKSSLTLKMNATETSQIMTVFPSFSGLTVKIDGKAVQTYSLFGGLMAFDLSEGEHTVTISGAGQKLRRILTPGSTSDADAGRTRTVSTVYAVTGCVVFVLLGAYEVSRLIKLIRRRVKEKRNGRY